MADLRKRYVKVRLWLVAGLIGALGAMMMLGVVLRSELGAGSYGTIGACYERGETKDDPIICKDVLFEGECAKRASKQRLVEPIFCWKSGSSCHADSKLSYAHTSIEPDSDWRIVNKTVEELEKRARKQAEDVCNLKNKTVSPSPSPTTGYAVHELCGPRCYQSGLSDNTDRIFYACELFYRCVRPVRYR